MYFSYPCSKPNATGKKNQLLEEAVDEIGKERDVFHIYNNVHDLYLHLDYVLKGVKRENIIAETDGRGRWFKWLWQEEKVI